MCGIAGIFGITNSEPCDRDALQRAMDSMALRGPDDQGCFEAPGIALGHRRLAVIDVQGGRQPFTDPESGATIVYNGEIYNFQTLRDDLTAHGHVFQTRSDTEVLLKAWRQWGVNALHRFNGMFAFAIYDPATQTLFAARDRLGVKPFFYAFSSGRFYFASTMAAMLCLFPETPVIDAAASAHYLTTIRTTLGCRTLIKGIRALLPGEYLLIQRGQQAHKPVRYWNLPILAPHEKPAPSLHDASEQVHALLEDSVQLRLISDVPLGGFLSGGLDSTILASLAAQLTQGHYNAYSVGYDCEGFNEWPFIEEACARYQMKCRQIHLDPGTYPTDWLFLIQQKGLPLSTPNEVPIYHLARALRKDFTVALSGEGADEIFGGYTIPYCSAWDYDRSQQLSPDAPLRKALRNLYGVDQFPDHVTHHFLLNAWMPSSRHHHLAPALRAGYEYMLTYYADLYQRLSACSTMDQHLHIHAAINLEGLLFRMDSSTMAASVEARVPFTDYRIAEFLFSLPDTLKIDWISENARLRAAALNAADMDRENLVITKRLLREAFRAEVPPAILNRRKMSFPVPFIDWFASGMGRELADTIRSSPLCGTLFEKKSIEELFESRHEPRTAMQIWPLANLCLWQRQFNIAQA